MSNEPAIHVTGNVGADPEIRFLSDGKAVTSFSLANTPSKFDKAKNEWVDGETIWFRVSAFGKRAEAVVESVRKGMRVSVFGVLTQSSYQKKDGTAAVSLEIAANSVGIEPKATGAHSNSNGGNDPWSN